MMKLIIQIPCYNEVQSLPVTLRQIPKYLKGVSSIETLIIDDGSTDGTAQMARDRGADHIVTLPGHQGLASAFAAGLQASLALQASIIINLDADNQYCLSNIQALIDPVLNNEADLVLGARDLEPTNGFSFFKRCLIRLGGKWMSWICKTNVPDPVTGFRVYSRSAAESLQIKTRYSHTIETLIQAAGRLRIKSVNVKTNAPLRASRLMKNQFSYIVHSVMTVFASYYHHRLPSLPSLEYVLGLDFEKTQKPTRIESL